MAPRRARHPSTVSNRTSRRWENSSWRILRKDRTRRRAIAADGSEGRGRGMILRGTRTAGSRIATMIERTRAGGVYTFSRRRTVIELDTEYKLSREHARRTRAVSEERSAAESRPRLFTGTCAVRLRSRSNARWASETVWVRLRSRGTRTRSPQRRLAIYFTF